MTIKETIISILSNSQQLSLKQIYEEVRKVHPNVPDSSIRCELNKGVPAGIFARVGKGTYALPRAQPTVQPALVTLAAAKQEGAEAQVKPIDAVSVEVVQATPQAPAPAPEAETSGEVFDKMLMELSAALEKERSLGKNKSKRSTPLPHLTPIKYYSPDRLKRAEDLSRTIALNGQIHGMPSPSYTFNVPGRKYSVVIQNSGELSGSCTCEDFMHHGKARKLGCKHILAAMMALGIPLTLKEFVK